MRLLSHMRSSGGTAETTRDYGSSKQYPTDRTHAMDVPRRSEAAMLSEIKKLTRANTELRRALEKLVEFAGPRTAIETECGDKIMDPRVLSARAVLAAIEAGVV